MRLCIFYILFEVGKNCGWNERLFFFFDKIFEIVIFEFRWFCGGRPVTSLDWCASFILRVFSRIFRNEELVLAPRHTSAVITLLILLFEKVVTTILLALTAWCGAGLLYQWATGKSFIVLRRNRVLLRRHSTGRQFSLLFVRRPAIMNLRWTANAMAWLSVIEVFDLLYFVELPMIWIEYFPLLIFPGIF